MYDEIEIPSVVRGASYLPIPGKLGLMNRLFGKRLRKRGAGWVTVYTGHEWLIDLRNPCHRWMIYGYYADPSFVGWCYENIPRDGVIVDSGSNIGQFLPYFSKISPDGRILAFEPSPDPLGWLRKSVARNENMPVEVIGKGLSDERSQAFIERGGVDEAQGLWGTVNDEEGEEINLTTLDEEVARRGIEHVHLWKLDVEGHEMSALRGATGLLDSKSVDVLYVEMKTEDHNNTEIIDFMERMEYDHHLFDRWGRLEKQEGPASREVDGIFLPQRRGLQGASNA